MTKRKVYVVPDGYEYRLVAQMFKNNKRYQLVGSLGDADLVVFVGGDDINPKLYGQHPHRTTTFNNVRDEEEITQYNMARELGIACVGICRGGQLLHVLNGGDMYQNVDNHNGPHTVNMYGKVIPVTVTSVHHQMMKLPDMKLHPDYDKPITLMYAEESTNKQYMSTLESREGYEISRISSDKWPDPDLEALYYPNTNTLCFQPHPEYTGAEDTLKAFFHFLDNYSFATDSCDCS